VAHVPWVKVLNFLVVEEENMGDVQCRFINKDHRMNLVLKHPKCRNPSFGLATKAKGLQGCGPKGSPGVTSGTPVNPHTPKATPALGDGVLVDSRNFRDRFEGSNLNGLWRSLYQ
jgi:hypothetical protein